jgi:hypothetical protein
MLDWHERADEFGLIRVEGEGPMGSAIFEPVGRPLEEEDAEAFEESPLEEADRDALESEVIVPA